MMQFPFQRSTKSARKQHSKKQRSHLLEHLEERRLLAITSSFDDVTGTLEVGLAAPQHPDDIVITVVSGEVQINDADPPSGPLAASVVKHIHVVGGVNTGLIDLSAVKLDLSVDESDRFSSMIDTVIEFDMESSMFMMAFGGGGSGGESQSYYGPLEESGEEIFEAAPLQESDVKQAPSKQARFSALAEQLIGPDWPSQLEVTELTEINSSSKLRELIDSKKMIAALDLQKVSGFLEETVGTNYASVLGIGDLSTYLRSNSFKSLWEPGQAAQQFGTSWDQIRANVVNYVEQADVQYAAAIRDGEVTGLRAAALSADALRISSDIEFSQSAEEAFDAEGEEFFSEGGFFGTMSMFVSGGRRTIRGSDFDDYITGTDDPDDIWANQGHDTVFGLGGDDGIDGGEGAGNDELYGGDGHDNVDGAEGHDLIYGDDGDDVLDGGEGEGFLVASSDDFDTIYGGDGFDLIDGGEGKDDLYGQGGDDQLDGGEGQDVLYGDIGADQLIGGGNADVLDGGSGDDTLQGGTGNDLFSAGEGDDLLEGGEGDDIYLLQNSGSPGSDTITELYVEDAATLKFSAASLGSTTITGWDVDWDDGSALQSIGSNPPTVNHQFFRENEFGPSYSITAEISNENNTSVVNNVQLNLVDPVPPPTVSISDAELLEGAPGIFYVTLSHASDDTITVSFYTTNGTAVAPDDYSVASASTLVFEPGETQKVIVVVTEADEIEDDGETFSVVLNEPAFLLATLGDATGVGTIVEELTSTDPPKLVILPVPVDEDDGPAIFYVALTSPAPVGGVSFSYTTRDGTAKAGEEEDYTLVAGSDGFIAEGELYTFFEIPIFNDDKDEGEEHFYFGVTNVTNATVPVNEASNAIIDDDFVRLLRIESVLINGNADVALFTVSLSVPSSKTITVSWQTEDGTAESPDDYEWASGTLTFNPGDEEKVIAINLVDYEPGELTELFSVVLSDPVNAVIEEGHGTGIGTILEVNLPPEYIEFDSVTGGTQTDPAEFVVDEGDTLQFEVIAEDSISQTLRYSLAPGAPAGAGFHDPLHPNRFSWTPTEDQDAAEPYIISIRITDDGTPPIRITQPILVTVNEVNELPEIASFGLLHDTGTNSSDWATIDPTLTGVVTNDGGLGNVDVVILFGSGFTSEYPIPVVASATDPNQGVFTFDPTRLGRPFPLAFKLQPREWDPGSESWTYGAATVAQTITSNLSANDLPELSVALLNNIGTIGDPASIDGVMTGTATNPDGPVKGLIVKVYDTDPTVGSPEPIDTVRTDEDGKFTHTTEGLVALDTDSDGEVSVSLWFVVSEVTPFGTFEAEAVEYEYTFLVNQAPRIETLALLHDTGTNSSDGITSDATIVGTISHADGPLEGITIEFDDDNDGDVDGVAVTDALGHFTYLPVSPVTSGSGSIDARAVEWDDYQAQLLASPWLDNALATHLDPLPLVLTDTANDAPRVLSLQPVYPNSGGALSDPTVWGMVSNDNGLGVVAVEFSFEPINGSSNHFDSVAGLATVDETGRFEFTPAGLKSGVSYTLYARAVEWDGSLSVSSDPLRDQLHFDNSAVESVALLLADEPLAVDSFSGIELAFDTGIGGEATNSETSDPTIRGTIEYAGDYSQLTVEFFHEINNVVDFTADPDGTAVPDATGAFTYVPLALLAGQTVTIHARVRVPDFVYRESDFDDDPSEWYASGYDPNTQTWNSATVAEWFDTIFTTDESDFAGDWYESDFDLDWDSQFRDYVSGWQEVTFTLDLTENVAASVASIELVHPGTPSLDPTIAGTVTNDGNVAGLLVEFYVNGNLTPDGTTVTDAGGDFEYILQRHTSGDNEVVVRVYEPTYGGEATINNYGPFEISIDANPDLSIASLELKFGQDNGSSGFEAIDPTLIGRVEVADSSSDIVVRFDYDGDGVADSETTTDAEGRFEFTPVGLALTGSNPQTTTVRVQAVVEITRESDGVTFFTVSDWSDITWDVLTNVAPTITTFELLHDTGNIGLGYEVLDRITTDPTVVGQIANDNSAGMMLVEFDYDNNETVDGSVVADEDGFFQYTPQGLTAGHWNLRARVREYDPIRDDTLDSGWLRISSDGNPSTPTTVYGFTLVAATQVTAISISHPGGTSDPTITGTVVDLEDGTDNLVVEFFVYDGTTPIPIGSADVAADGTFAFTPVGLPFGDSTISAEVVEWDYATGAELPRLVTSSPLEMTFSHSTKITALDVERTGADYFDPTIGGAVATSGSTPITPQYVEIDINGDGTVEAIARLTYMGEDAEPQYEFSYRPDLPSSNSSVMIKVRPVGATATGLVFGNWASTSITYDLRRPSINSGWTISDNNTSSPTISGGVTAITISSEAAPQAPFVEFDINGDGVADATVATEPGAFGTKTFTYTFSNLLPGDVTITARAVRFETVVESGPVSSETIERTVTVHGEWQELEFTLVDPAPRAVDIELVNEVGGTEPLETTDPTIRGSVESDGTEDLLGLTVEIDHDGDGIADGTAVTDEDGEFEYTPRGLQPGEVTLKVRAIDLFSATRPLFGDWAEFEFTLLAVPAPVVNDLVFSFDEDTGTGIVTSHPAIVGNVTRHETVDSLTVEFDYDDDERPDGSATVDALGNFSFTPSGLGHGNNKIRARGVAYSGGDVGVGAWSEWVDFYFASTQPPVIAGLSMTDAKTGEISGRVTVDGFGETASVEVAVLVGVGVRVTNGFATTDANGFFTYIPKDLPAGAVDIEVRALLGQPSSTALVSGEWQAVVGFDYDPDPLPTLPPEITEFRLDYDTGTADTIPQTADPTVVGTIDWASPLVSIQISHDNGTTVEATVVVAKDGSFSYVPQGLDNLDALTLSARYRLWDPFNETVSYGTWTSAVVFTLDASDNDAPTLTTLVLTSTLPSASGVQTGALPLFAGQVANDGSLGGLIVRFDHNDDGIFDGSAFTQDDGSFLYFAQGVVPDAEVQTIDAQVFERDYFGNEITTGVPVPITFLLEEAPVVSELEYAPAAGTDGELQGHVQTSASPATTHIEYQLFGNYEFAPETPTELAEFEPNEELRTSTVDSSGDFAIDLAAFALGLGPASIVARAVDSTGVAGPWRLLHFVVAPASVTALGINGLGLVEDTGLGTGASSDRQTSNPTIQGTVGTAGAGAYAVVEITIDDGVADPIVRRTVADATGHFIFTPEGLALGQLVTLSVRHVVYDPVAEEELVGTASTLEITPLNNNDTATITGFDLLHDLGASTVDPTVKGTVVNDGRRAGLKIEFDTNGDETADGFTFADAAGYFEWTPYNVASGQPTTVRARVVEWDGIAQEYTSEDFADSSSVSRTFTLADDGPPDPTLEEGFAADLESISHTESEARTGIISFLASIGAGDSGTGSIDVGIGSIRLLHRGGANSLDDGVFSDTVFQFTSDALPTIGSTIVAEQGITSFATGLGVLNGDYDLTRAVAISGDTITVDITFTLRIADYHSDSRFRDTTDDIGFERSVALDMSGVYSFEYHAIATYTGTSTIEISGTHTLEESLDYDYLRAVSTSFSEATDGGHANGSTFTTAGHHAYQYEETDESEFDGDDISQPFTYTETNSQESWRTDSRSEITALPGRHSSRQVNETEHTFYSDTVTVVGVVLVEDGVQTATGVVALDAFGSASFNLNESVAYSNSYEGGSESGSSTRIMSAQSSASLAVITNYATGGSASTQFTYSNSLSSSVFGAGNGQSSSSGANSSRAESWDYQVTNSLNSSLHSLGGIATIYTGGQVTDTYSISASRSGLSNSTGSGRGSVSYSSASGESSNSGSSTTSSSFNRSSTLAESSSVTGVNDQFQRSTHGQLHFTSSDRESSSGDSSFNSPTESHSAQWRGSNSANSTGDTSYTVSASNDLTVASGTMTLSITAQDLTASQTTGTREVPDGDGGTVTVPERANRTDRSTLQLDSNGQYSERRVHSAGGSLNDTQLSGNSIQRTSADSQYSSYVGIAGDSTGHVLTKGTSSQNGTTETDFTRYNDDFERTGTYDNHSEGSSDTVQVLSSTDTSGDTTVTNDSRTLSGSDFSNDSSGETFEDNDGSSASGTSNSASQGYSDSTSERTSITDATNNYRYSKTTSESKSTYESSGETSFESADGEIVTRDTESRTKNTSRTHSGGNEFSTLRTVSGDTTTFQMDWSEGSSRNEQNGDTSTNTSQVGGDIASTSHTESDYSGGQNGSAARLKIESTLDSPFSETIVTTEFSSSRSTNEGGGSGDTTREGSVTTTEDDIHSKNTGHSYSRVAKTTTRVDTGSYFKETVTRTDTTDGMSSFDGHVSKSPDGYSKNGEVKREDSSQAKNVSTSRRNFVKSDGNSWTNTDSTIESSEKTTFDGELTENSTTSTLTGDSTVIEKSKSEGIEVRGRHQDITGGFERKVDTDRQDTSRDKKITSDVTTTNGVSSHDNVEVTSADEDKTSEETVIRKRTKVDNVEEHFDQVIKNTSEITDHTTPDGPAHHTERTVLDEHTDTYRKHSVSGGGSFITTTVRELTDTTTLRRTGNQESLETTHELLDAEREVGKDVSPIISFSVEDPGRPYDNYTRDINTTENSSYSSAHEVTEEGLAVGGRLTSESHKTMNDMFDGRYGDPSEPSSYSHSHKRQSSQSWDTSETGSYYDIGEGANVERIARGSYRKHNETQFTEDWDYISYFTQPWGEVKTVGSYDHTSRIAHTVEGSYGPEGDRETVTEDSEHSIEKTADTDTPPGTISTSTIDVVTNIERGVGTTTMITVDYQGDEPEVVVWHHAPTPTPTGGALIGSAGSDVLEYSEQVAGPVTLNPASQIEYLPPPLTVYDVIDGIGNAWTTTVDAVGNWATDLWDRSTATVELATGEEFTNSPLSILWASGIAISDVVGVKTLVQGISGYDLTTGRELTTGEQIYQTATGFIQTVTTLFPAVRAGKLIGSALLGRFGAAKTCFIAGTLVATEEGQRPIETVAAGELVWSCDLTTGEWILCRVAETYVLEYVGDQVTVFADKQRIESTYHHPYWVVEGENLRDRPMPNHVASAEVRGAIIPGRWVDAGDLMVGDVLLLKDGRRIPVEAIEIGQVECTVYNFAVEDLQNYAVGPNGVLVHNNCLIALVDNFVSREITQGDLGIKGTLEALKGTVSLAERRLTVRIDMIQGVIENPFSIIRNLKGLAQLHGATTLRVEGTIANETLYKVLSRYGLQSSGATDFLEVIL